MYLEILISIIYVNVPKFKVKIWYEEGIKKNLIQSF